MKTILPIALLLLGACGGASPEAKFLGLWEYQSGTREGVSCDTHVPESTSLVGNQVVLEPDNISASDGPPSFVGSVTPCRDEVWSVTNAAATLRPLMCILLGSVSDPRSRIRTFTGSLMVNNQVIALNLTERLDLAAEGKTVETCTYTYQNATLGYVGPYIP